MKGRRSKRNRLILLPELDENNRLHWHGVIHINNMYDWKKKQLPSLQYKGFVKIKSIFEAKPSAKYDSWYHYATKDQPLMAQILDHDNIHYCNCDRCIQRLNKDVNVLEVRTNPYLSKMYHMDVDLSDSDEEIITIG